jgi:hypothetical protein
MRIGPFEINEPVPELSNTIAIAMLRPWIDVGRVGTLALRKLENHFGAKELGRLARPGNFFDFTRYRPRMGFAAGERTFTVPNTVVNYINDEALGRPLLLLHIREPHALGEDYADGIAELLAHFRVTEYCRIGGMYDSVPHTRPLIVTGTLTEPQYELAGDLVTSRKSTYQGPTSIVNQVAEEMRSKGADVTSLMVHVPQYARLDDDRMGAARLLECLSAIYGLPDELADSTQGRRQYLEIGQAAENNADVNTLISQLESYYDRTHAGQTTDGATEDEEQANLPPEVEKFLTQLGSRFDESEGDGIPDEE